MLVVMAVTSFGGLCAGTSSITDYEGAVQDVGRVIFRSFCGPVR